VEWRQPPIAEYALIGDGRTASIDWLCVPRFNSEPVFGQLVGGPRAGSFSILVEDVRHTERHYREGSAVVETTHRTALGDVRRTDGMVLGNRSVVVWDAGWRPHQGRRSRGTGRWIPR
jgi:GH15 family glucan-1,4-alpha-glucosidase